MSRGPLRIIPCLDMKDGRVVKGVQFENLRDAGDPVETALAYEREDADELVLIDITATTEGRKTSLEALRRITAQVKIPICMTGGFATLESAREAFAAGASAIGVNTAAVRNPEFLRELAKAFPGRVVLAVDVVGNPEAGWSVVVDGGHTDTGMALEEWAARAAKLGAARILLTSKTADGTRAGYDLEATRLAAEASGLPVIASGGAGSLEDFERAYTQGCASAALAASLFHFRTLTVKQVKEFLAKRNIPVLGAYLPDLDMLQWTPDGLIPAIAQDVDTGAVLMMAWMNRESLTKTAETGFATYYSRSRQRLWKKGETSGNVQRILQIDADCDRDALLLRVRQTGVACHTGAYSCFAQPILSLPAEAATAARGSRVLQEIMDVIDDRKRNPKEGSYTNYLLDRGVEKIAKKVGEETAEVIIAAVKGDAAELRGEAADLIYHLCVLLYERGVPLSEVFGVLEGRR